MNNSEIKLKFSYISGLESVVIDELEKNNFLVINRNDDSVLTEFKSDLIDKVKKLRSVSKAYLVLQDSVFNPSYISNHKSILNSLIDIVLKNDTFKTFKISCAGADSPEVRGIARYIEDTYKIVESESADLKIHIVKLGNLWEIGVQITALPLSVRDYKVMNMSGAMDPTIAYTVNHFADLSSTESYLNIFSGSATLLIEAAQCYESLNKLVGFDNDKKHLSLSIQNIKKAGFIKRIEIKEADIFDNPDFGKFDVVVSDLPFGMSISKGDDIEGLYKFFVKYSESTLNPGGKLIVYTAEHELFENVVSSSNFKISHSVQLKIVTNVNSYIRPKIFVCELN
jgi:23S rRNA G2445 N2-methylase RlmL